MKTKQQWLNHGTYEEIKGRHCAISLEPRPSYCDRGNWVAKVEVENPRALHIDAADAFPRYYFYKKLAKLEIEAWLERRQEYVLTP